MQHLTEEDLVLLHYRDADTPLASEHLRACDACRAQYDTLKRVLALVSDAPVPERGPAYAGEVWNRLRWRLDRKKRRTWQSLAAIAAVLAIAFVTGQWWEARQHANTPAQVATGTTPSTVTTVAGAQQANPERFLILVVGDHLESSERVLTQLANADPQKKLELDGQQTRVQDLLVSNRLYRQSAAESGDKGMASILSDLEPVLTEIANAPSTLTAEQVRALQRRIDAQGLLFKVRLISAQTSGGESAPRATGTSL